MRENADTNTQVESDENPCKSDRLRRKAARLKIVVSPVRVRVSPSRTACYQAAAACVALATTTSCEATDRPPRLDRWNTGRAQGRRGACRSTSSCPSGPRDRLGRRITSIPRMSADVEPRFGVAAGARDGDPVDGGVDLTVAAAVEAVAVDPARADRARRQSPGTLASLASLLKRWAPGPAAAVITDREAEAGATYRVARCPCGALLNLTPQPIETGPRPRPSAERPTLRERQQCPGCSRSAERAGESVASVVERQTTL